MDGEEKKENREREDENANKEKLQNKERTFFFFFFFFFFYFCAFHFKNHWNLFLVYQNENFLSISRHEKKSGRMTLSPL